MNEVLHKLSLLLLAALSLTLGGTAPHSATAQIRPHDKQQPSQASNAPPIVSHDQELEKIATSLRAIEENTKPEHIVVQIAKDTLSNFVWEVLGFEKSGTTIFGKITAALGVLLTLMRIWFFFWRRTSGEKTPKFLDVSTTFYLMVAAPLLVLLVFSTSAIGTEQQPAAQLKELHREVVELRRAGEQLNRAVASFSLPELKRTTERLGRLPSVSAANHLSLLREEQSRQAEDIKQVVANAQQSSASFWLQVLEIVLLVILVVLGGIVLWKLD